MSFNGLRRLQNVHRRIGGLERVRGGLNHDERVHRRIGGLENIANVLAKCYTIYRPYRRIKKLC